MTARTTTAERRPELRSNPVESRSGLARRSALGGMAVALALAISAFTIGVAIRDGARARADLVNRVDPAILHAQRLGDALDDQAAAVHAYAARPNATSRADYDRATARDAATTAAMTRLLRSTPDSAPSLAGLDDVTNAMAAWRRDVAGAVLAKRTPTDPAGPLARTGEQRLAAARTALSTERARLAALQRRTDRRLRAEVHQLYSALAAGAGIVVIGAIVLTMLIRLTLVRPVTELTGRVRRVAAGDFDHPLDVTGPAEIAELAAHVDAMRDHIVEEWRKTAEAQALLADQATELRRSNAALGRSNADLGRSNSELEQFAYVASHDLQEPLRNVANFCQRLERRYSDVLDDRGRQYIEYAVAGVRRMQALIDDLLALSRVGRSGREMTAVHCDEVLRAALDDLGLARSESDAGITSDPMPEVTGDRALLTHLFQNLIGNAIKFRGDAPPRVHIGVRRDGDAWEFSCADNGIGIDPGQADRIFLVFQRLHPREDYTGTGIGLALCKKIVEYHGGRIWLDTEPRPQGTVIRWTLPVRAVPVTLHPA